MHSSQETVTYTLKKTFRYDYSETISNLQNTFVIAPPSTHGGQKTISTRISVFGSVEHQSKTDTFGNHVLNVHAASLSDYFEVEMESTIERENICKTTLGKQDLRVYLEPTSLTKPSISLERTARLLKRTCPKDKDLATHIRQYVYAAMCYAFDTTSVWTTAEEAFSQRTGICQDYSHIMISLCRSAGIAARYVSGHLVADGSGHAWVETLREDGRGGVVAEGHDPTNDCTPGLKHIVIATGRDYNDVPATAGCFDGNNVGSYQHACSLKVIKTKTKMFKKKPARNTVINTQIYA